MSLFLSSGTKLQLSSVKANRSMGRKTSTSAFLGIIGRNSSKAKKDDISHCQCFTSIHKYLFHVVFSALSAHFGGSQSWIPTGPQQGKLDLLVNPSRPRFRLNPPGKLLCPTHSPDKLFERGLRGFCSNAQGGIMQKKPPNGVCGSFHTPQSYLGTLTSLQPAPAALIMLINHVHYSLSLMLSHQTKCQTATSKLELFLSSFPVSPRSVVC